ncbi:U3 small nucleolar ribonucleoprotein complex, subunit Mpp10 [Mortierella sp. GBAus27b]|nr:hypothetical protein BGX31_007818 [Mortierella sp. GBA43]KAI8359517.1 U3 small nucleolar ribonucleoprotein complex, subunit Mpp10 [Mortierella sp. GBAus27b]
MAQVNALPDEALLKSFTNKVLDKPEVFLTKDPASAEQAKAITKYLYDLGKSSETGSLKGNGSMLEELFVDGFDNDQIWEEIHMQNAPFLSYLKTEIKTLKSTKAGSKAAEQLDDNNDDGEEEEDAEMSLGLDDEDMGLDMDDTDNMEGLSGEEDDDEALDSKLEDEYEEYDENVGLDNDEEEEGDEDEDEEDLDDLDLPIKKKSKSSELDDDFFNLDEFNALTEKQEEQEEQDNEDDDDEIDYFADPDLIDSGDDDDDDDLDGNDDEADAHDVKYSDFFAPASKGAAKRSKPAGPSKPARPSKRDEDSFFGQKEDNEDAMDEDAEEADDDDSAEVNELGDRVSNLFAMDDEEREEENLSKFEKQQRKLQAQIEQLEQENVAAKDWTIKGEASSRDRPVNSLLEEDLEFETVAKPVPVITAETTQTLEDIIKERILSATWDDVVRKAAPNPKAFNPSSKVELSDEKSKKSLAELYEDEYARKTSTTGPVLTEKEVQLEKKHEEITTLWQELCQKLDSLSNWHYTPKPLKAELTVVTNAPAISMEEAIPVSVADAALLAPEEVYSAGKAPIKGDTEMEQSDRKRKRAQAKKTKKAEVREKDRKDAERRAEKEAKDRRLGRQPGDKGSSKTVVRDKLDAVKALSGQKNISFIDRDGNKRSSIKSGSKAVDTSKGAKLKL